MSHRKLSINEIAANIEAKTLSTKSRIRAMQNNRNLIKEDNQAFTENIADIKEQFKKQDFRKNASNNDDIDYVKGQKANEKFMQAVDEPDYVLEAKDIYTKKASEYNKLIDNILKIIKSDAFFVGDAKDEANIRNVNCVKYNYITSINQYHVKYNEATMKELIALQDNLLLKFQEVIDEVFKDEKNQEVAEKINPHFFSFLNSKIDFIKHFLFAQLGENYEMVQELKKIFLHGSQEYKKYNMAIESDYLNDIVIFYHTITDNQWSGEDMKQFFECAGEVGTVKAIDDCYMAAHKSFLSETDRAKLEIGLRRALATITVSKNQTVLGNYND